MRADVVLLLLASSLAVAGTSAQDRARLEVRLGPPAGCRVPEAAVRGAPLGSDGVATLTIRLDVRGSACLGGCWLRQRMVEHHLVGARSSGVARGKATGYLVSLAKVSAPATTKADKLVLFSWGEALAWDVMSNASSPDCRAETLGDEGRCLRNAGHAPDRACPDRAGDGAGSDGGQTPDQRWSSLYVEVDVAHFGETEPTVEGLHCFDLRLEGPSEHASWEKAEARELQRAEQAASSMAVGGWGDKGWQGHPDLALMHQERTVIWTPPPQRMRAAVIYHHLGMGDHIICAGLVRRVARDYQMLFVVVHRPYLASFARLFRDVPNVHPFAIEEEEDMRGRDELLHAGGMQVLRVGYHKDHLLSEDGLIRKTTDAAIESGLSFAEIFYRHAGLEYSERWAYPIVPRDSEKEESLWQATQLNAGSYAFVHDDPSRGLFVDRSSVPSGLLVFHPSEGPYHSNVIFDYSLLIERAAELHLMDSAFALLADALNLTQVRRKVLHVYSRINPDGSPVVKEHKRLYKQDWELLRVPEGAMHMGFAIDHPADGEPLVMGVPVPEEYNLPIHRRVTFSFLDLSPFPARGVRVDLLLDGTHQLHVPIENKPGMEYAPGTCPFLVGGQSMNVGERLKDTFGRCEVDVLLDFKPGQHTLELHISSTTGANSAIAKAFSTFEVVMAPDDVDPSDFAPSSPAPSPQASVAGLSQGDQTEEGERDGLFWVAVSNGEALDKLTILNIKRVKIKDPTKLFNIHKEARLLSSAIQRAMGPEWLEHELVKQLTTVNWQLWEVEDDVRKCEANKDFGAKFVQLSRSVYKLNDERGRLKREINRLTSSGLVEEKHYASY